jgi:hypothetical protein
LGAQLAAALEAMGEHLLAGRVGSVREARLEGETLVLCCGALPAAARKSLREATDQLNAAVRQAGLASGVQVDENGSPAQTQDQSLRTRVESDEGVKCVLEVFGGRLGRVEEKP